MSYLFNLFVLILFILIAFFVYHYQYPNVHFLTKSETQYVLEKNSDSYYDRFTKKDLKSRNIESVDKYKKIIMNNAVNIDNNLRDQIIYCIYKITDYFRKNKIKMLNNIDIEKYMNLEWKISLTTGNEYEYGLPHTRNDIIMLNKEKCDNYSPLELCKTLIHEKVHVYQKVIPDFQLYINENYEKVNKNNNTRSNPDTDDIVYKNIYSGVKLSCEYDKDSYNVNDVKCTNDDVSMEHPYELIAYKFDKISNQIMK